MTHADDIRQYVLNKLIQPARARGAKTVTFTALEVHNGMRIEGNRMPNVCSAIDSDKFLEYARVTLAKREGPLRSTTAKWTFNI